MVETCELVVVVTEFVVVVVRVLWACELVGANTTATRRAVRIEVDTNSFDFRSFVMIK